MKNKIKYLIKACIDKKIKTKWFKITNIVLLILIVGIINLNTIVKSFGGDFDKMVNNFTYYNCVNSETGRYPAFYVED